MATGTSVFLIALGAILAFAVEADVAGLDIATVGVILMIAGVIGLLVSLFWIDRLSGPRSHTRTTVVDDAPVERRVVEESRSTTHRI
jgi:membrane protein implicated in regulation of membrane protease activity